MKSPNLAPRLLAILRIVAMINFISHGTQKLFDYPPTIPPHPWPGFLQVAGGLEIIGGLMIAAGLFTRPVAFILCGEMAVAYFRVHAPRDFWPLQNGGEITVLYCFFFLYLVAEGAGAWSLDSRLRSRQLARG
ncbi:MAG TPA: DoxX family protein, partial [Terriglobia bacterium]|nr:DoxX family protein [Terriglobia bacterium]